MALPAGLPDKQQRISQLQEVEGDLLKRLADRKAAAPKPLSQADYLQQLAALDVGSEEAVRNFQYRTQILPGTEPIALGSHSGHQYYLLCCADTIPYTPNPFNPSVAGLQDSTVSAIISEYRRVLIPGATSLGRPEIQYGFGLGKLMYGGEGTEMADAGFYVLFNAIDKSVWIAIDWYPTELSGTAVGDASDDWGIFPGDDEDSAQGGVVKISQLNWEKSDPLKMCYADPLALRPIGCRLEANRAQKDKFLAALKAAADKQSAGR
ncbi:hypothetical protein LTS15_005217 [Exophiala xenobiotica]|nr:hypothetical protein LTS15_005217 [Exophiala xenobiotica]